MKDFNLVIIGKDEPIKNDNFFLWLNSHDNKMTHQTNAICEYLDSLGFIEGEHKIKPSQWEQLVSIFKCYTSVWMPIKETLSFSDIFTPCEGKLSSYDNQNNENPIFDLYRVDCADKNKRYRLTDSFLSSLGGKISMVYPINSWNYYFEIINGQLFIKYQYIIGSRRLCKVDFK